MTPDALQEQALIDASRLQRERLSRLNAELSKLDEKTLQFDPKPDYRAEVKERFMSAETYTTNVRLLRKRVAQMKGYR